MSHDPAGPAAVLFDMDGTLVDSEGLWLEAEQVVMAWLGGTWTDDDQAHCLGGPLERVGGEADRQCRRFATRDDDPRRKFLKPRECIAIDRSPARC